MNIKLGLKIENKEIGRAGYMDDNITYKDLCKVFGKPTKYNPNDEIIRVEWTGEIEGLVFKIYDYKSAVKIEKNTFWSIGGTDARVADLVNIYFILNK